MTHENSFLISGLRDRYARALGEVRSLDTRRKALKADLAHLKAVLRLCADDMDPSAIRAIRPVRKDRAQYFADALNILRLESAPMTTREIAKRLLAARDIAITDEALRPVEGAVLACMRRQEKAGVLSVKRNPNRWSIAP